MTTYLNIKTWKRYSQFEFFRGFDHPFFNICSDLDISRLLDFTREYDLSFFLASLFLSTKAANSIEEFRYRIRDDGILIHETIHAGSTILNDDETFGFCYFDYSPSFKIFEADAKSALQNYHASQHKMDARDDTDNMIHYSIIPWVSFTSFAHARQSNLLDSTPKIVFGKYQACSKGVRMPVSVEVHHALMDGVHVGKYFELFQNFANSPEASLGSS